MKKNVLLLYKGYPRISHSYQLDEAEEMQKENNILIISFDWELLTKSENYLPYLFTHAKEPFDLLNEMKKFKPDIIHSHYFDTFDICKKLSNILKIPFTIRSHSFDILSNDYALVKSKVSQINSSTLCKTIIVFPEFYDKLLSFCIKKEKLISSFPSINIKRFNLSVPNGKDIMSGGAFLPKKNIEDFIILSKKIKQIYPEKNITYYSVIEEPLYFEKVNKFNIDNGSPVIFKTCQPSEMPLEYKKHEWLIYGACPKLKTVGNPIMVAEAQASGVGVIMYKLRPELIQYVTEDGYLYVTH